MLNDVVILRLTLIMLLVLYHSFCIFSGAWQVPEGYQEIPAYWWIAKTAYSFMLETFVFISGYVYGYQVRKKGTSIISLHNTIVRKAKRLLLPSIFFGTQYYVIFYDLSKPLHEIAYTILNGAGHLWFLPMLFWCFVGVFIVEKLKLSPKIVLPASLLIALCSFLPLPFRIANALYYFLFFFVGYCINRYLWDMERLLRKRNVMTLSSLWLALFIMASLLNGNVEESNDLLTKIAYLFANKLSVLCYSSIGLMMAFLGVNLGLKNKMFHITPLMIKMSGLCFGVYVYQQFILKIIYYQVNGMERISPFVLPWIGFLCTTVLSLLFAHYTLKTRFGRFLIG